MPATVPSAPETKPISEIKTRPNGYTSLLVSIHITARERLAEASRLTGVSQQQIIRNGIEMALMAILDHPAAKEAAKKARPRRARKGGHA